MNVIEREFNALAADYESNRLAPWYQAQADLVLDACGPLESGEVLDVGCGTGYLLRSYLARNPGARGVGIDIAGGMVERAEALAAADGVNTARFITADWETMDPGELDEYKFRLAFCTSAFHYFSAPRQAAEKLCRALAADGTLYLIERNKSNSPLTLLWGWLHRHLIKDNVEFYSLEELIDCFRAAGFTDVTVARTVNRLLWKNKLYTSVALLKCTKQ